MCATHYNINTEFVSENISVVLSKSWSKKCRNVLKMSEDKPAIFDKDQTLHKSASPHCCINTLPDFSNHAYTENVLVFLANLLQKQKQYQINRIHKQSGIAQG